MDAPTVARAGFEYNGRPPILIAATSDPAMRVAQSTIDDFDLRVGATLSIEDAIDRMALQPSASAVWIEVDRDCGSDLDVLLDRVSQDVADGRYSAIVSTRPAFIDPVMAAIGNPDVDVIVDPGAGERAAALGIALARKGMPTRVADVASDQGADQLRHLSEEVNRIASMLARLSTGPAAVGPAVIQPVAVGDDVPPVDAEAVRRVIRARRLRARYFPEDLFADPAWDMLLDLLQAELAHLRVPVSSLCIAAAVPATTALRWLKTMVNEGLFIRRADPHDGRRVFVELAPQTRDALHRYFAEVEGLAA